MKIGILNKGDKVIAVNNQNIAVQRKNGEVDLIPITFDEDNLPIIDREHIVTITYGNNTVEFDVTNDDGGSISITTF